MNSQDLKAHDESFLDLYCHSEKNLAKKFKINIAKMNQP